MPPRSHYRRRVLTTAAFQMSPQAEASSSNDTGTDGGLEGSRLAVRGGIKNSPKKKTEKKTEENPNPNLLEKSKKRRKSTKVRY